MGWNARRMCLVRSHTTLVCANSLWRGDSGNDSITLESFAVFVRKERWGSRWSTVGLANPFLLVGIVDWGNMRIIPL